jgi:CelD/BcsL family acetyltransferase involved in cellulose biosynthesis
MNARFETRILTVPAQLHGIAGEWIDLCEHCTEATPFQRPEWLLPWTDAFCPKNIFAVEVRREKTLVGLAPLLVYPRDQEQVLAFMGGGVSDYLDLLATPGCEDEILAATLDAVNTIGGWTTLDLTDLPANSVLHRTTLRTLSTPHDYCSALKLPSTKNELLQLFSKRQRANLRNAQSRLERAGGGQFELATAETFAEFLEDLFRLHASRWSQEGQPGVLADEQVKAFHRESAPKLTAKGILRLYRLRLKERTIAVLYALLSRSTVFCYLQGFDPEFAFVSPGTQLMFFAMEDAVQLGMRKFDFLRGEEAYKSHWRAQTETTYRIHASRPELNRHPMFRYESVRNIPIDAVMASAKRKTA